MNSFSHIPVLLQEATDGLNIRHFKKYIDATLGGGGHSSEIVKRGGLVLGIDQDEDALEFVKKNHRSKAQSQKLKIVHGNFGDIKSIAVKNGFEKVDGILFDLGVSSYQMDSAGRGFSIKRDERLDMRMDVTQSLSAYEVINAYPKEELVKIFYNYGEEHNSKGIAEAVVFNRRKNKIETTKQLAEIVEKIGHKSEAIHPATRVFQAIRIEVNGELEALKKGLSQSLELLETNGRIVVISFHSLEDRITKQIFEKFERENMGIVLTKKPLVAGDLESARNRRARSAKLRIFERK